MCAGVYVHLYLYQQIWYLHQFSCWCGMYPVIVSFAINILINVYIYMYIYVYIYIYIYVYVYVYLQIYWCDMWAVIVSMTAHRTHVNLHTSTVYQIHFECTGWRRVIGCLIFTGQFPQKRPIISGSFANNDLQLKASYGSSPPCIKFTLFWVYQIHTQTTFVYVRVCACMCVCVCVCVCAWLCVHVCAGRLKPRHMHALSEPETETEVDRHRHT